LADLWGHFSLGYSDLEHCCFAVFAAECFFDLEGVQGCGSRLHLDRLYKGSHSILLHLAGKLALMGLLIHCFCSLSFFLF